MSSHFSVTEGGKADGRSLDVPVSFNDEDSGCLVARAMCDICNELFEEELEEAKAKILSGEPVLCLVCDDEAEARDITAVMVWATVRAGL